MKLYKEGFSPFTKKVELIHLFIPVVLLIFSLFEIFQRKNFLGHLSYYPYSILANIILLNVTHNAFTILLLTTAPTMKSWVKRRPENSFFWQIQGVIAFGFCLVLTLLLLWSFKSHWVRLAFTLVNFIFATQHALSQSFGLSLLYQKELPKERWAFNVFLYGNLLLGSLFFLIVSRTISLGFFTQDQWILVIVGVLFALGAIVVFFSYSNQNRTFLGRFIFSLRYFLWPLTYLSPLALFGTLIIHGIEYLLVTSKMLSVEKGRKSVIGIVAIVFVVILAGFRMQAQYGLKNGIEPDTWIVILAGVSFGLSFFHYHLDRQIFRMRFHDNKISAGYLLSAKSIKNS